MFNLQEKWIELDSLLEGVQSEMKEKQIVSNYLKSLGMKRTVPVVIQQKLQDRRLARIYVWKNSPIGNVALLTGRSIEPSLHFLVLETENHDGDEIDMAVAISGTNYVSIPIPHTLERRMAQNSHSVHQQPVHSQRPVHHKPKPVQRKSKAVKSKRKPARRNPPIYGYDSSVPSPFETSAFSKFFPDTVVSKSGSLGESATAVLFESPYLTQKGYNLAIVYDLKDNGAIFDITVQLRDMNNQNILVSLPFEMSGSETLNWHSTWTALSNDLIPFASAEFEKYIANPSAYTMPTRKTVSGKVVPIQKYVHKRTGEIKTQVAMKDMWQYHIYDGSIDLKRMEKMDEKEPVVSEPPSVENMDADTVGTERDLTNAVREGLEQVIDEPALNDAIDDVLADDTTRQVSEPQDQSDQVRIKYDFEGLQEEPIIPITDDLLFTLDDFADVKWTTKIDYKNLWWIFAKNMTLQPICERLNKLFVPKVEDIGKAIVSSEWCVKQVNSTLSAGKQEKVEMIFGLSETYTKQKTKFYGSPNTKSPTGTPETIDLAFGITSQSNGLRLRVGKCTNGESLNGFTPQKAYRLTMPYNQFKGMHLKDVMVAFFNMVLIHILSNPNILAKIGEYCDLPTRQTFTGVTKTVIQPTVDRTTVVPRPVADEYDLVIKPANVIDQQKGLAILNKIFGEYGTVESQPTSNDINLLNMPLYPNIKIMCRVNTWDQTYDMMIYDILDDEFLFKEQFQELLGNTIPVGTIDTKDMTVRDAKYLLQYGLDKLQELVAPRPVAEPSILDTVVLALPNPLLSNEQKDTIKAYLDQKYNLQYFGYAISEINVVSMGHPTYINYIQMTMISPKVKAQITIRAEGSLFQQIVRKSVAEGTNGDGTIKWGVFSTVLDEKMMPQNYTVNDLIPILDTLIDFAKSQLSTTVEPQQRIATQSVRDTLSNVMPQIEFIKSLDQVSTEPSLNRWYAGSLAYDFPTTGNYFEIVLFAHYLSMDNELKLTIKLLTDVGTSVSSDDYFALLAKVEQTQQGTDLTDKTFDIQGQWYAFFHNAFNGAGITFTSGLDADGNPQFIIQLGQQTTQRVASPAPQRVATPSYDFEGLKKWAYDGGYINGKKDMYQSPFDEPTFVATMKAMDGIMSASHKKELVEMYFKGWQEGSHRALQAQTAQEPSLIEGVTANEDALNLKSKQHTQLKKFITQTFAQDFPQWNADALIYSNRVEIFLSDLSLIKRKYNFSVLINKDGLRIFGYISPYFDNNSLFNIDAIANQVSVLTIQDLLNQMMLGSKKIKEWIVSNGSDLPTHQIPYFGSSQEFAKHLRKNPYSSAIAMQIDETLKTLSIVLVTITGHKQKAPKLFIKPVAYVQMYDPTKMNFTSVSWDKDILVDHSDLVDNSFLPMAYFESGGLGYKKLHYNEIKTISDYLITLFEEGVVSWTQSISTLPIALNPMVAELGNQSIANSIADIKGMITMAESLAPNPIDHLKVAYEYSIDQNKEWKGQNVQEPRIQTPKIQLADAMEWAVKRGVFNFETYSTFKAPAQDKELMDLHSMVVNEYGSSAGQDLFDAYTASWNKAHKDFTDAQLAQQQAQQTQTTVEPPQGSTGSLGTQISTIDDLLQYPDGTLFVTPNQNNDYEIRVLSKIGDEIFGFDEDGSALTIEFDELADVGDLFYQSIQVDPFRIQQVFFDQSESKQLVDDALQAIGM